MTDASGINTDAYQAELQAAADSLVAAFPKKFQADFKVYDFGFYDLTFATTYDVSITNSVEALADSKNINLVQYVSYYKQKSARVLVSFRWWIPYISAIYGPTPLLLGVPVKLKC